MNNCISRRIKNCIMTLVISLSACFFVGCSDEIPEMSDEDMERVEEYAAYLLLKYDKNYSGSILSNEVVDDKIQGLESKAKVQEQIKKDKEAEEEAKRQEEAEAGDDSGNGEGTEQMPVEPVYADIADFLDLDGISIEQTNTVISQIYPSDADSSTLQGLPIAGRGNVFVTYEFAVRNNSDSDYYLDINSMNLVVNVKINGTMNKVPVSTILSNNFTKYIDTIPANEERTVFVMIELSEENASSIESAVLTIKKGDSKMSLSLL